MKNPTFDEPWVVRRKFEISLVGIITVSMVALLLLVYGMGTTVDPLSAIRAAEASGIGGAVIKRTTYAPFLTCHSGDVVRFDVVGARYVPNPRTAQSDLTFEHVALEHVRVCCGFQSGCVVRY